MPKIIHEKDVFAAVSKVFANHGYDNATTKLLAEAAGMHEATLFRKFQSKEKLFIKAIAHEFSRAPLAHVRYTGQLEADLLSIVNAYIDTLDSHGDIMTLLFVEVPRHPELEEASTGPMKNIEAIIGIVEQYQARGYLVKEDAMHSVAALIGPLMARHMLSRTSTVVAPPEVNLQDYINLFLRGRTAHQHAAS